MSVDGKHLDKQLVDFRKLLKIRRYYIITRNFLHEEISEKNQLLYPGYITPGERAELNDFRKKTKETLRSYRNSYISRISCRNTGTFSKSAK